MDIHLIFHGKIDVEFNFTTDRKYLEGYARIINNINLKLN